MTVRRILKTDSVFGPLLIMLQTFFVANAYASMIIVPDDYEVIEMAVHRALEGDTVLIRPGVYTQYLGIFDEGITFAGEYIFSGDTTDINETILLPAHPGNLIYAQYEGEDTSYVKGLGI